MENCKCLVLKPHLYTACQLIDFKDIQNAKMEQVFITKCLIFNLLEVNSAL